MLPSGEYWSCSSKTVKPKLRWRDIEYVRQKIGGTPFFHSDVNSLPE